MKRVFEDIRHCAGSFSSPDCQHESPNCDVCCGDGACNYGECKILKGMVHESRSGKTGFNACA
ncbi:hypothetical protein DPMN_154327 [Dreissena polymorpha]|uniref:Uncharacterized protein n=1 Tax=Dreissena polymorpha TaxID=45954 RepID=A0A9D4J9S9_DREPO|nr:hypothetical protein DPMN_154327 [Dreissena polymorpha]